MKNQKHIFNTMLVRYYRYVRKLKKLIANGVNFRKQEILEKRIAKLFQKLNTSNLSFNKATTIASIVGSFMLFQPNTLKSQNFDPPQINPFGLVKFGTINTDFNLVDLDNDGDKDIFARAQDYPIESNNITSLYYFENVGSPSNPQFNLPILNPSWLPQVDNLYPTSFVDIDSDGDIDMFYFDYFYENTGNASSPIFTPKPSPIPLDGFDENFVDIDGDGDLDVSKLVYFEYDYTAILNYFENIGSASTPIFNNIPFYKPERQVSVCDYADMDNDGDIDMFGLDNNCFFCDTPLLNYYENTGNVNSPIYDFAEESAFNLPPSPDSFSGYEYYGSQNPRLVDLNNDGNLDIINLFNGNFYFYEIGDNCDSPDRLYDFEVNDPLTFDGIELKWTAPANITKCELKFGVKGKKQFTKTLFSPNASSKFVKEKLLKANTFYEYKVRCDCEPNNQYGPYSYIEYLYTDTIFYDLDWGFPKSGNLEQSIFEEESNVATTSNKVKLFPNPAKGNFSINTDLENYNLELTDVTGKLVYSQNNINQTSFNFDIKQIDAGTYFVKISNANASEVIKLMVD